jgi:hypothetical protein
MITVIFHDLTVISTFTRIFTRNTPFRFASRMSWRAGYSRVRGWVEVTFSGMGLRAPSVARRGQTPTAALWPLERIDPRGNLLA